MTQHLLADGIPSVVGLPGGQPGTPACRPNVRLVRSAKSDVRAGTIPLAIPLASQSSFVVVVVVQRSFPFVRL